MIKIGQILKARREELGYTPADMSVKAKISQAKLTAIEEGNLAYFKDELTYVKFYVRFYFNLLHLNYDDYKDQLNEALDQYTETSSLKKIADQRESTERVKTKTASIQASRKVKDEPARKKVRPKADVAFVSMFVISVLIVLALIYVFVSAVLPMISAQADQNKVVVVPDPIIHDSTEDPGEVVPEVKVLTVTMIDPTHYEVTGFEEGQDVTLIVSQPFTSSWLGSKINGVKVANPTTGFYEGGAVYTLIVPAVTDGMVVEQLIGWVFKQKITINDVNVPLDKSVYTSGDKTYFYFTFKGETP